jgi:hypothetical protein
VWRLEAERTREAPAIGEGDWQASGMSERPPVDKVTRQEDE